MTIVVDREAALDGYVAALKHLRGMRGKAGEALAKGQVIRALETYNECPSAGSK